MTPPTENANSERHSLVESCVLSLSFLQLLISETQPRETVGEVVLAVMENKGTYGMVLDLMEGEMEIGRAVEQAVEKGLSSWHD
jgi:hypothetical protein